MAAVEPVRAGQALLDWPVAPLSLIWTYLQAEGPVAVELKTLICFKWGVSLRQTGW